MIIIFDSSREDGITEEPQTSAELHADDRCLVTDMPDAAGLKFRWPQIEALSQHMTSASSYMKCVTEL